MLGRMGRMHFAPVPALCRIALFSFLGFLGNVGNCVMVGKRAIPKKVPCCNSTQYCPLSHGQPVTPHTLCCARSLMQVNERFGVFCVCACNSNQAGQVNVRKFFIVIRDNRMTKITARNLLLRSTWNLSSYSKPFFLIGADSFSVAFALFLLKRTKTYVSIGNGT